MSSFSITLGKDQVCELLNSYAQESSVNCASNCTNESGGNRVMESTLFHILCQAGVSVEWVIDARHFVQHPIGSWRPTYVDSATYEDVSLRQYSADLASQRDVKSVNC